MRPSSIAKSLLAASGALRLARMFGRRGETIAILRYHSVSQGACYCPQSIAVSPGLFERQVAYVARNYRVLALDDAVDRLAAGAPLPVDAVAITFDDGYRDNHDAALPILLRYGLPATFFCVAGPILDGERFWVAYVQEAAARVADPGRLADALDLREVPDGRDALARAVMTLFARSDLEQWPTIWARIDGALLPGERPRPSHEVMMTAAHLRALVAAGMTVGSHTTNHPVLASLPDAQVRDELTRSRARLEAAIGQPVRHLAYPNAPGVPRNFDARSMTLAAEAGYRSASTSIRGTVTHGDNPMALRRQGVNEALAYAGFTFKLEEHRFLGVAPA